MLQIEEFELKTNLLPKGAGYAQVYSGGLEYAPLNEDNEMLSNFITCKDFFNDLIYAIANNQKAGIYGFNIDPTIKDFKASLDKLRVAIRIKGDNDLDGLLIKMVKSTNFINDLFSKLGFQETSILGIGNFGKEKTVVVSMPSDYSIMPPLMSAFLLSLRAGANYDKSNELSKTPEEYVTNLTKFPCKIRRSPDAGDLKCSIDFTNKVLKNGSDKVYKKDYQLNYPKILGISTVHNNLGIRSYMSNYGQKDKLFHEALV